MKKTIILSFVILNACLCFSQGKVKEIHLPVDTAKETLNDQLHEYFWDVMQKRQLKETYIGQTNIRFKLDSNNMPINVECSFGTPAGIQDCIKVFFNNVLDETIFHNKIYKQQDGGNRFYIILFKYYLYTPGMPYLLSPENAMQHGCMNRFKSDFTATEIKNNFPDCTIPLTNCILLQPVRFDNSPKKKPQSVTDSYNIKAKLRMAKKRQAEKL
jgi:hypothetical protein